MGGKSRIPCPSLVLVLTPRRDEQPPRRKGVKETGSQSKHWESLQAGAVENRSSVDSCAQWEKAGLAPCSHCLILSAHGGAESVISGLAGQWNSQNWLRSLLGSVTYL